MCAPFNEIFADGGTDMQLSVLLHVCYVCHRMYAMQHAWSYVHVLVHACEHVYVHVQMHGMSGQSLDRSRDFFLVTICDVVGRAGVLVLTG